MMASINYAFFCLIFQLVLCESRYFPSFEKEEYRELSTIESSEIGLKIDRSEELSTHGIANTATPVNDEISSMASSSSPVDAENATNMADNSTVTEMELVNFLPENDIENVTDSNKTTDEIESATSTTSKSLLQMETNQLENMSTDFDSFSSPSSPLPYELDVSVNFEESFDFDANATTSDEITDMSLYEKPLVNVSMGSNFGIANGSELDRRLLNQSQDTISVSAWSSDADHEEEEKKEEGEGGNEDALKEFTEEENTVEEEKDRRGNKSTSDIIDYNGIDETDQGCGIPSSGHRSRRKRIVGGTRVIYGQLPWLVSLHFRGQHPFINRTGFNHLCGASLISPSWLLTTAHCFSTKVSKTDDIFNTTFWSAVVGEYSLAVEEKTEKRVEIAEIIIHENFTYLPVLKYDVALLKLTEPVTETQHIKFICLDQENIINPGEMCTVAGWGVHSYEGTGSAYPFQTTLTVLSQDDCDEKVKHLNAYYRRIYSDYETKFCADSDKVEDSCQGDSGGPLQCYRNGRWYVTGLVSSGYGCGELPGVYARVGYVIDWIKDQMKQN